jgi:hypothetical protein
MRAAPARNYEEIVRGIPPDIVFISTRDIEGKMLIQSIKDGIWECIKDNEVALFMISSA